MKVFLDTNILVDLAENRQEAAQAAVILQLGEEGRLQLSTSFLTFANLGYIWLKVPRHQRYERIRGLSQSMDVLQMDAAQLQEALKYEAKDYEDMLQYQCALAGHCDVIVTNNVRDYDEFSCQLPFMTSRDFLLFFFREHAQ